MTKQSIEINTHHYHRQLNLHLLILSWTPEDVNPYLTEVERPGDKGLLAVYLPPVYQRVTFEWQWAVVGS